MRRIYYNNETRQFTFNQFAGPLKSKVSKFLDNGSSGKAGKLTTGLGLVTAGIGLAGGLHSMASQLNNKSQFVVIYRSDNGAARVNVKAVSSIDAVNAAKSKSQGTEYKAFRLPDQEDQALNYYESLK